MATKYLQEYASEADFLADAVDAPSRVGHAAVGEVLVINKGGSVVEVIDETATQTLTNKTLTSPTINGAVGTEPSEVVTATNVLTAAESGTTFFLHAAAGFLTTFPAPALGLLYRFIVKTAPTTNGYTFAPNGGTADIIVVNAVSQADASAGITDDNADLVTLVANQAAVGDYLEARCDGTKWFIVGQVKVTAGLTSATT
jgi:hypothetical protein